MKKITIEKYKSIIDEWLVNGYNGRKAYKTLYPLVHDNAARVEFNKLLEIPEISDYLISKTKDLQLEQRIEPEGLIRELERWIYSDITEFMSIETDNWNLIPSEMRGLIKSFKKSKTECFDDQGNRIETTTSTTVELVSKLNAIDILCKLKGYYNSATPTQIN